MRERLLVLLSPHRRDRAPDARFRDHPFGLSLGRGFSVSGEVLLQDGSGFAQVCRLSDGSGQPLVERDAVAIRRAPGAGDGIGFKED
ncbi:hypothetical protein GCM10009603_02530 [Nocardiopsis exhalans]